jgi:hypothetical protein
MDIVKYTSRYESSYEIVTVNFPDGLTDRAKSAWVELADEKARELKIEFIYDYTDTGIEVEFYSKQDCEAILAAMTPDWKQALIESFNYQISMSHAVFSGELGHKYDPEGFQKDINRIASDYGLTVDEIAEVHPLVNDLS